MSFYWRLLGSRRVSSEVYHLDEPDSSVGKESACHEEKPSSIPRLGKSTGEGIGYPLQYSWTSLVAQMARRFHTQLNKGPETP